MLLSTSSCSSIFIQVYFYRFYSNSDIYCSFFVDATDEKCANGTQKLVEEIKQKVGDKKPIEFPVAHYTRIVYYPNGTSTTESGNTTMLPLNAMIPHFFIQPPTFTFRFRGSSFRPDENKKEEVTQQPVVRDPIFDMVDSLFNEVINIFNETLNEKPQYNSNNNQPMGFTVYTDDGKKIHHHHFSLTTLIILSVLSLIVSLTVLGAFIMVMFGAVRELYRYYVKKERPHDSNAEREVEQQQSVNTLNQPLLGPPADEDDV